MTSASNASGNFFVSVWSDAAGTHPDTSLETLSGDANPATTGNYTYSASGSGLSLSPNTKYWIVLGVSSGDGNYRWNYTNSSATTGSWTIPSTGTYASSDNAGTTWGNFYNGSPQQFEITATAAAVPEPGTMVMGGLLALGGSVMSFRRMRRAKAAA